MRPLPARVLLWGLCAAAALLLLLVALIAALDAGYLKNPLIRLAASISGRPIRIESLRLQVFTLTPRLSAEGLWIGNPAWMPAGTMADIGKLTVVFGLPGSGHRGIDSIEAQAVSLRLFRDSTGHANWLRKDPDQSANKGFPLIRALTALGAHVVLKDELRHLQFEGSVSAHDANGSGAESALRIDGSGQLNGRPVTLELRADPLAGAESEKPYHFNVVERSSGSSLSASGFLLRPFVLSRYDLSFEAAGEDLKDLHYLVGTNFVDTVKYRLSGKLARRGNDSTFSDLALSFGQSDVHGTVQVESLAGRSKINAVLSSQLLRMADVGARAAGRAPQNDAGLLLPTATPDPAALLRNQATVNFQARRIDAGRVALLAAEGKISFAHGVLTVTPFSAQILGGKLSADLKVDATTPLPAVALNMNINGLELGQLPRKTGGPPPIEGPLQIHASVAGRGKSVHQAAASAHGTLTAALQHGTLRASLAELTGIDFRGLGLSLAKNKYDVLIRCGVANFDVREGILTAQRLVLDTEPVLISGEGMIHMDSESLDLTFSGHPKGVRILRLRAPLLLRGTLAHPSLAIQGKDSKLVLVDRGVAQDADCAALLSAAP